MTLHTPLADVLDASAGVVDYLLNLGQDVLKVEDLILAGELREAGC